MGVPPQTTASEQRESSRLMDLLVRVALIGGLALLCYQVISPFLMLAVWSIILAVTLYPLHRWVARKLGGKQGLTATLLVVVGVVLIVVPTALLMSSFADSIRGAIDSVQNNTVTIPVPRESVQEWPIVGKKIYGVWSQAHDDLPALVQSLQPKIGELARRALGMIASIGGGILLFLASFIVAGILMAYGEAGAGASRAIFRRVAGPVKGDHFTKLSTATIRTVAQGVVGVAAIQAILIGLALMIAGIKVAGVLAIAALILGIAQVPALIITLPVIIYIWTKGDYGTGAAVTHTIILLITGMADNVLKPLLLGRGVDAPMPVILFGALGGMASLGIPGMFIGATGLALGYEIYRAWVAADPGSPAA